MWVAARGRGLESIFDCKSASAYGFAFCVLQTNACFFLILAS
jgi:hypothetical protein